MPPAFPHERTLPGCDANLFQRPFSQNRGPVAIVGEVPREQHLDRRRPSDRFGHIAKLGHERPDIVERIDSGPHGGNACERPSPELRIIVPELIIHIGRVRTPEYGQACRVDINHSGAPRD